MLVSSWSLKLAAKIGVSVMASGVITILGTVVVKVSRLRRLKGWQKDCEVPHSEEVEVYYYHNSICSQKVLFALAEKGIKYKKIWIDIGYYGNYDNLKPSYLKINPNGTVPTLVHKGHPVLDSDAILDYLEANFKHASLEGSGDFRAEGDLDPNPAVIKECKTLITAIAPLVLPIRKASDAYFSIKQTLWALFHHPNPPLVLLRLLNLLFGISPPPPVPTAFAFARIEQVLSRMESRLCQQSFLGGNHISLDDISVAPVFFRLDMLGLLNFFIRNKPNFAAYWKRLQSRPSFAEAFQSDPPDDLDLIFANRAVELHNYISALRARVINDGPNAVYGADIPEAPLYS